MVLENEDTDDHDHNNDDQDDDDDCDHDDRDSDISYLVIKAIEVKMVKGLTFCLRQCFSILSFWNSVLHCSKISLSEEKKTKKTRRSREVDSLCH